MSGQSRNAVVTDAQDLSAFQAALFADEKLMYVDFHIHWERQTGGGGDVYGPAWNLTAGRDGAAHCIQAIAGDVDGCYAAAKAFVAKLAMMDVPEP